jgi:hypothetical protein
MKLSRRHFIGGALTALAALHGFMPRQGLSAERRQAKLRILILGGTGFLGPHTVRAALARGHELTLFNRGKTNPGLFADVENLRGDRDGDLEALEGRSWDAVIDTSGYVPRIVGDSARLLAGAVRQYVFISSVSVYADFSTPGADESAPLGRLDDESVEEITGETYGPLKALSERAAEAEMPGRLTVIRPGLIVGKFTWVDAAFLEAQGVAAWSDLPVWLPAEGEYAGSGRTSAARAMAAGLGFRPLRTTAADTLAWWQAERAGDVSCGPDSIRGASARCSKPGMKAASPAEPRYVLSRTGFELPV